MSEKLTGFTAYSNDKECMGLVTAWSDMRKLETEIDANKNAHSIEIAFQETSIDKINSLILAKRCRLTLCKTDNSSNERWELIGDVSKHSSDRITLGLLRIKHYINDEEWLYWDNHNMQHKVRGRDLMKEIRLATGMEE